MEDAKYKELYDNAQHRMEKLYQWLKERYDCEINYTISYASHMKLSEYNNASIEFKGVKALSNSISLNTYMIDRKKEYFLSVWYYTGGSDGHHSQKFDIARDLVDDDEFFFEWVNDYIQEIFKLKDKTKVKKQFTIFDFLNEVNNNDFSRI